MDVAELYGINPFALSSEHLDALHFGIRRMEARRRRRFLEMHPEVKLSADGWYDLVLAETGSKLEAEEETCRFLAEQLRAGVTPA